MVAGCWRLLKVLVVRWCACKASHAFTTPKRNPSKTSSALGLRHLLSRPRHPWPHHRFLPYMSSLRGGKSFLRVVRGESPSEVCCLGTRACASENGVKGRLDS